MDAKNEKTAARFRERFALDAVLELRKMYSSTVTVVKNKMRTYLAKLLAQLKEYFPTAY